MNYLRTFMIDNLIVYDQFFTFQLSKVLFIWESNFSKSLDGVLCLIK